MSESAKPERSLSILNPFVDAMCVGGLSLLAVIGFRIYADATNFSPTQGINADLVLLLNSLINYPHFMASYRLLYNSRANIRSYPWASFGVPAFLILLAIVAFATTTVQPRTSQFIYWGFIQAGMLLLAWHYTGQTWGMISSFMFLRGVRMDNTERWMIRPGLTVLMLWHLIWAMTAMGLVRDQLMLKGWLTLLLTGLGYLSVAALLLGAAGFVWVYRRTGKLSLRALLAWLAIFSWYWLISKYPKAFPILQISHALQYLIFPIRVEMNCAKPPSGSRAQIRGLIYYLVLFVVGMVVLGSSQVLPDLLARAGATDRFDWLAPGSSTMAVLGMLAAAIQIHHYFTDGAVWKLSNPRVRRQLFAHVK